MINYEALFKVSYGLYIVTSGNRDKGNGFISNTVFQVTAEPPKFASCCSKNNYTLDFIIKHKCFSVSVLHTETPPEIFGRFGYRSGSEFNKLEGMDIKYGETGVPIVLNDSIACLEFKLVDTIDLGTHLMFIGELVQAEVLKDHPDPITYLDYRRIRKGLSPKNAPTYIDQSKISEQKGKEDLAKYECAACGYIYDDENENPKFQDLSDDWVCPLCGAEKEDFYKLKD